MEEMIDVYDHDRNRTGLTIPREGAFLTEGQSHEVVVFLKIWESIPRF